MLALVFLAALAALYLPKKTKKIKRKKTKGQRPKREFNIVISGQFHALAIFDL